MYESGTIPTQEKLKLIPFAWSLAALILGITCGLWSAIALPLLALKWVRPYAVVLLFGAFSSTFLFTDTHNLPINQNMEADVTLTKSLQNGIFEAELRHYSAKKEHASINTKVIVVIFPPFDSSFRVSERIKGTFFSERITKEPSSHSSNNALRRRGFRHRLILNDRTPLFKSDCTPGWFTRQHDRLTERINTSSLTHSARSLLLAIVLGDKSDMERTTKRDFSRSGVSHILAISGLHIGILFMILSFLCKGLDTTLKTRTLKALLILFLLWMYTFLIGAPASAVRATMMCSLFAIGSTRALSSMNRYNTLFAAAFVMLIFNPTTLYDIGFQLSFTAVAAILYVVPKVEKRIQTKNRVIRYILTTCAVTLSAQIAVTPLTMYYFGEFSAVALVSNLLISPLIVPFLFLSIATTLTLWQGVIVPTQWLCDLILLLVRHLQQLPYAHFSELNFDLFDLICCYTAYVLILVYFKKNSIFVAKRER